MSLRKAAVLDLASAAYEVEADVKRGMLQKVDGQWVVDGQDLGQWLDRFSNQEVVLIAASLSDDRPLAPRMCTRCGRDFIGIECPTCRAARIRLRGR